MIRGKFCWSINYIKFNFARKFFLKTRFVHNFDRIWDTARIYSLSREWLLSRRFSNIEVLLFCFCERKESSEIANVEFKSSRGNCNTLHSDILRMGENRKNILHSIFAIFVTSRKEGSYKLTRKKKREPVLHRYLVFYGYILARLGVHVVNRRFLRRNFFDHISLF